MPRKTWVTYESLAAADVNTYLANQSVMVFATTAARDAALPSPTTGMQSAVTASPDLGAPRYWNGSAWTLVNSAASVPAVWSRGAPDTSQTESIILDQPSPQSSGTWYQITGSMPVDAVITGLTTNAIADNSLNIWRLGTGAAGSEVVRWVDQWRNRAAGAMDSARHFVCPYGINVPSGTRVAIQWTAPFGVSGGADNFYAIHYTRLTSTPTQYRSDITSVSNSTTTAWTQIAATPPIAGGCWVIGANSNHSASVAGNDFPFQFGLGAAGSEVAYTPYYHSNSLGETISYHPPFWWPTGTRLAWRALNANTSSFEVGAVWREELT